MAMDLRRQKKDKVPAAPLNKSIQVWLPLRDVPLDEMIGKRMSPPKIKRIKPISEAGNKEERDLMMISVRE